MSAFYETSHASLQEHIRILARRMTAHNALGLTHDEYLDLFAPPEHWHILKEAGRVADVQYTGGTQFVRIRHPGLERSFSTDNAAAR